MRSYENKLEGPIPFDMICAAATAKINREEKLAEARKLACIDVWDEPYVTPVTVLAARGKVNAVDFLLSKGASYGHAGCGYASVGNDDAVNSLLDRVKDDIFQLDFFLKQTVYGYTFCKDRYKLDNFIKKIKEEYPHLYPSVLGHLALGHAKNENISAAYDVLRVVEKEYTDKIEAVLTGMVVGFAYKNKMSEVKKVFNEPCFKIADCVLFPMVHSMTKAIVACLAERGMEDNIVLLKNFLMELYTLDINKINKINKDILLGSGIGHGHRQIVSEEGDYYYVTGCYVGVTEAGKKSVLGSCYLTEVKGYARGGHVIEAYELSEELDDYRYAIEGFVETGRIDAANEFLNKKLVSPKWNKNELLFFLVQTLFLYKNEEAGYLLLKKITWDWTSIKLLKNITLSLAQGCNKKIDRFLQELKSIIQDDLLRQSVLNSLIKNMLQIDRNQDVRDILEKIWIQFPPPLDCAEKILLLILQNRPNHGYFIDKFTILKILGSKINHLTSEFTETLKRSGCKLSELQRLYIPFNRWSQEYNFTIPQTKIWVDPVVQAELLVLLLSPKMQRLSSGMTARIVLFLFGFATKEIINLSGKLQAMRTSHQRFFLPVSERKKLMIQKEDSVRAKISEVAEGGNKTYLGKRPHS